LVIGNTRAHLKQELGDESIDCIIVHSTSENTALEYLKRVRELNKKYNKAPGRDVQPIDLDPY